MDPYYNRVKPRHLSPVMLDLVLSRGWYRMRQDLFTISHLEEERCYYRVHWLRYEVNRIAERATHRRIRKKNKSRRITIEPLISISEEHRNLHRKYRKWIEFDGVRSIEEGLFGDEVDTNIFQTWCISVYDQEQLIAAGYFDAGSTSVASILHFFDPDYSDASLGKFLILCTLDWMRAQSYNLYYPGYVVAGKPKMDYKLFLGESIAEYYDLEEGLWKPFNKQILLDQPIIFWDNDRMDSNESDVSDQTENAREDII